MRPEWSNVGNSHYSFTPRIPSSEFRSWRWIFMISVCVYPNIPFRSLFGSWELSIGRCDFESTSLWFKQGFLTPLEVSILVSEVWLCSPFVWEIDLMLVLSLFNVTTQLRPVEMKHDPQGRSQTRMHSTLSSWTVSLFDIPLACHVQIGMFSLFCGWIFLSVNALLCRDWGQPLRVCVKSRFPRIGLFLGLLLLSSSQDRKMDMCAIFLN